MPCHSVDEEAARAFCEAFRFGGFGLNDLGLRLRRKTKNCQFVYLAA